MNTSTNEGVSILKNSYSNPIANIFWWHIVNDNSSFSPFNIEWSVTPSLGSPREKASLRKGLENNVLTAISAYSTQADNYKTKLPANKKEKTLG